LFIFKIGLKKSNLFQTCTTTFDSNEFFSMTRFLPLFPLGLVVFPDEYLNLRIFEPRYQQLINECEEQGMTFGVPPTYDSKLANFGTEVKLLEIVKRFPDGKMNVKTQGIGLFKIEKFYRTAPKKLYSGADIIELDYTIEPDVLMNMKILDCIRELYLIMNIDKELPEDPAEFSTYRLAHHVGFSTNQELKFLQITDEKVRQQFMLDHLEHMIPIVKEAENLRMRARMNGHFKDIISPDLPENL